MMRKKKGFTLIELIIVVAIIGILAAIAVPKFGNIQKDAKTQADVASAKTIADAALVEYSRDNINVGDDGTIREISSITLNSGGTLGNTLQSIVTPKSKFIKKDKSEVASPKFYISISNNGDVKVYAGEATNNSLEVYPNNELGNKYPVELPK